MYYLSTVIEKLVTTDNETRRADRHHAVQRAARAKRSVPRPDAWPVQGGGLLDRQVSACLS